jgi:hypothetical protein
LRSLALSKKEIFPFVRILSVEGVHSVCTLDGLLMKLSKGLKFGYMVAAHVSKVCVGLLCDNSLSIVTGGVQ